MLKRLAFLALTLTACAHTSKPEPDALAGNDVITMHGKRITSMQAQLAAREARYVLLGELHDNPRHHQLQAAFMAAIADAQKRPAVVFEMIDIDQIPVVRSATDPETFGELTAWEKRGWPDYAWYRPIVHVALATGMPITGGNLDGKQLMAAVKKGDTAKTLGFAGTLPPEQVAQIENNVREGHCGQAKAETVQLMSSAQQLRDAYLARRLLESATSDGAILIAGAEHTRRDHGVAFHVPQALSIGFVEDGEDLPTEAFDIIWRTAPTEREDPCKAFADKLERVN